jgi:hypothetical protein
MNALIENAIVCDVYEQSFKDKKTNQKVVFDKAVFYSVDDKKLVSCSVKKDAVSFLEDNIGMPVSVVLNERIYNDFEKGTERKSYKLVSVDRL